MVGRLRQRLPKAFKVTAIAAVMLTMTIPTARSLADESSVLSREELKKILIIGSDPQAQLRTLAAIARQPISDNDIIVPWIEQNTAKLDPPLLLELARRLFEQSHADALEWFAVGYARAVYDAKRCEDPTAGSDLALVLFRFAGQPLTSYLVNNPDEYGAAQQRALTRADLFTDEVSPAWICVHGMSAYSQAITGNPAQLEIKPREQWPALQQSVREGMAASVEKALAHQAARKALPAGTIELRMPHKGVPFSLAWSPDGKRLAMTLNGDQRVAIWDLESRTILREIDRGTAIIDDIAFVSGGQEFVTSSVQDRSDRNAVVTIFTGDSGIAIHHFGKVVPNATFAVDDRRHLIAYLTREDRAPNSVVLTQLDNPDFPAKTISIEKDSPQALAFGPKGILAVGTVLGKVKFFDVSSGEMLQTIDAFKNQWIETLAFSPDGRYIAVGAMGGQRGLAGADGKIRMESVGDSLKVWKTADDSTALSCAVLVKDSPATIRSIAWTPDSRHLAYIGYDKVHLLNLEAPQESRVIMQFSQASTSQYSREALAFSQDGSRLAMTGDSIALIVPLADPANLGAKDDASCK